MSPLGSKRAARRRVKPARPSVPPGSGAPMASSVPRRSGRLRNRLLPGDAVDPAAGAEAVDARGTPRTRPLPRSHGAASAKASPRATWPRCAAFRTGCATTTSRTGPISCWRSSRTSARSGSSPWRRRSPPPGRSPSGPSGWSSCSVLNDERVQESLEAEYRRWRRCFVTKIQSMIDARSVGGPRGREECAAGLPAKAGERSRAGGSGLPSLRHWLKIQSIAEAGKA